jgi:diguanylate cyclase (GGDEF)-like protein
MMPPIVPSDEILRLRRLDAFNVLDTAPEERFDRYTRMARRLLKVPIALISLVDDNRQWFKSCDGLEATETPRRVSFCGHAILRQDVLLVTDAVLDPRFADNPLVVGPPHIRFYAGVPLMSDKGSAIGTLCVIDTKPREASADDLHLLADLARFVEHELFATELATTDSLTGIPNRRGFESLAGHALQAARAQRAQMGLLYLDLDGFKDINDRYGHAEGDYALRALAEVLSASIRYCDNVGRMGGDEFAVLMAHVDLGECEIAAERIRDALLAYGKIAKWRYELRCSIGICVGYPHEDGVNVQSLLRDADAAMFRQKSMNRRLRSSAAA